MTLDTPVIRRFAQSSQIRLPGGLNLQVLPDMSYIPGCQKHQSAAYLSDRAQLIVWDDDPTAILARASKIEVDLLNLIWKDDDESLWNEKKLVASPIVSEVSSVLDSEPSDGDVDVEATTPQGPKHVLVQPFIVGVTMALMLYFSLLSWTYIIQAVNLDGQYLECAYILMLPFTIWTSLFFWQALAGQICQLFGPVKQVHQNSRFYSGLVSSQNCETLRQTLIVLSSLPSASTETASAVFRTSPSRCQFTKKVFTPSSSPPSAVSMPQSPPTKCKEELQTSSSTTTVSN